MLRKGESILMRMRERLSSQEELRDSSSHLNNINSSSCKLYPLLLTHSLRLLDRVTSWIKNGLFLLFFYYFFFGGVTTAPTLKHSMSISRDFPHEVVTPKLGIPIYVND
jgi:hypothetical protein